MGNKVKYNLKNVHAAKLTKSDDGTFSYAAPKAIPGAVSISLDAEGDSSPFYADGIVYFRSNSIDGIAASAASVIAMAGTKVLMSPVSMMMIHNPATIAFGDHNEMQKAIEMLESVKDSIINAYEIKTSLSRAKLSRLMEAETWMDATKAVELGFADDILQRTDAEDDDAPEPVVEAVMFSRKAMNTALLNKLEAKYRTPASEAEIPAPAETGRSVDDILERLDTISKFM